MTKPVQIQAQDAAQAIYELECQLHDRAACMNREVLGAFVQHAIDASEQSALIQVRSLMEAKAKEWDNWADMHLDGEALTVANKCHFDLLALAATLGNQGK